MLDLASAAAGEGGVDVSPNPTERLPQAIGFFFESVSLVGRCLRQEPAVKLVAVAGDARKEVAESERGMSGAGAVS